MIEARHTFTGKLLADYCSGRYMDRFFRRVYIHGTPGRGDYPVLILANHFSWWDGFIQYRLNREVFGRRLYVMMLEEQLRRHKIMNRCGCFSVRKNSRSILETLRYSAKLLENPANMVLIFPQGRIGSLFLRELDFESGAGYLGKLIGNDYRMVFNVNLIDYGPYKKPSLNIYHRTVDPAEIVGLRQTTEAFNRFYNQCVASQSRVVW